MTLQPFAPLASAASGSEGGGGPSAAGLGILLQSMNLSSCNASSGGITDQRSLWMLVTASKTGTVNTLGCVLSQAGVTVDGAGINGMGLFTEAGVLMSRTADMSAAFGSTGVKEANLLVGQGIVQGTNYYLNVVTAFTGTQPQFLCAVPNNSFPTINTHFSSIENTNYTAWASFTPSGQAANGTWIYVYGR